MRLRGLVLCAGFRLNLHWSGVRYALQRFAHDDRGSSTVVSVAVGAAALGLTASLGLGAQAFLAHARADSAADLAALAAADAARGITPGEPCEIAEETAKRGGAKVSECIARPDLGTAKVVTEIDLPAPLGTIRATAVAGSPTARSG